MEWPLLFIGTLLAGMFGWCVGVALDDNQVGTPNLWRSNRYSDNVPFASPYLVPGTAGATDISPVP